MGAWLAAPLPSVFSLHMERRIELMSIYDYPESETWTTPIEILSKWTSRHSDAFHPGSRETCGTCQWIIKSGEHMPPASEIREYTEYSFSLERRVRQKKLNIPDSLRWDVWERDDFTCQKCGIRRYLQVDHIHPESKGGTLTLENLQTLCKSCNCAKGSKIG